MSLKWSDNGFDWELLVRQLAQLDVFEPGTAMPHPGLRNRRRIWRILEEMRIDDVPHVERDRPIEEDSSFSSENAISFSPDDPISLSPDNAMSD